MLMFMCKPIITHAQLSTAFIHYADSSNINLNYSIISHPSLNDSANAIPVITHRYNMGFDYISYVNKKLGAWFIQGTGKWTVYNQDKTSFTQKSVYNVLSPGTDMNSFIHKSDNANVMGDYTTLDHPSINNNPNAIFLVNDLYKGTYNLKVTGIYYNANLQRWRIFNMDGSNMAVNQYFNIVVAKNGQPYGAYYHTSSASNIVDNRTALNIPSINNNPDALVFVSQIWPAGGAKNDNNVGVYYSGGKWYVYNETNGGSPTGFEMPEKAGFNIVYFLNKQTQITEQNQSTQNMNVFPNPVQHGESLNLTLEESLGNEVYISLYSTDGKCVFSAYYNNYSPGKTYSINIDNFSPGIYTMKVESENQVGTQKVMIK